MGKCAFGGRRDTMYMSFKYRVRLFGFFHQSKVSSGPVGGSYSIISSSDEEWSSNFTIEDIPQKLLEFKYSRASGPGGQNVNKTNSKVDLRLSLNKAAWIPEYFRKKLFEQNSNKINSTGEMSIVCESSRSQQENRTFCIEKLYTLIKTAAQIPKPPCPQYQIELALREKKYKARILALKREHSQFKNSKKIEKNSFDD